MLNILYEDEYIVACEKKPGMLSEESQSHDSIPFMLKQQLGTEIYTLHRLDKPVGGVIIYAKTKKAASAFSSIIAENKLSKTYLAVLDSIPEKDEDRLQDLLFKDSRKNKTFVVKRMRKGVKEAVLTYKTVAKINGHALVQITLETGRSHQIRVQFASRKMPLTGDGKYGSRNSNCDIALLSHSIQFIHPFTGQETIITCEPDYNVHPWNMFRT